MPIPMSIPDPMAGVAVGIMLIWLAAVPIAMSPMVEVEAMLISILFCSVVVIAVEVDCQELKAGVSVHFITGISGRPIM